MKRVLLLAVAAFGLVGCSSAPPAVVARARGLTRDRYVLPPEPPPPRPLTADERRALEAEWPAPTTRDPFPENTIIVTWDASYYAPWDCAPAPTCSAPRRDRDCAPSTSSGGVFVRVAPTCASSVPRVILEMQ